MRKKIAVLPGDGVGPEVVDEAIKILSKIASVYHHSFEFLYGLIGATAIDKTATALPDETLQLCKESDSILFGAIGDPKYDLNPKAQIRPEQGLLKLRKELNLYANLRPVRLYPHLSYVSPLKKERIKNVDFMVVRELTGGIYFGQPRLRKDNGKTAIDTCIYTKAEISRVAKIAFDLASKRKKRVTSVDKANVLETSRLWRETVTEIANDYPQVELTHLFVDNAAMQLIKNPSRFDVILTENMFGDILTDEASVIAGSLGLLPSASIGDKYELFEPIHGSFPKAAGKQTVNPVGTILSAAMMLEISFHMKEEAKAIEVAIESVFANGYRTKELAVTTTHDHKILSTGELGNKIVSYI